MIRVARKRVRYRGTRIAVEIVLRRMADGYSMSDLLLLTSQAPPIAGCPVERAKRSAAAPNRGLYTCS